MSKRKELFVFFSIDNYNTIIHQYDTKMQKILSDIATGKYNIYSNIYYYLLVFALIIVYSIHHYLK